MKKKLLIISTYKIKCGLASYTAVLETLLGDQFEIDIAPLDPFILKEGPEKEGDEYIRTIIEKSKKYDFVNFQWDHGILGSSNKISTRRFRMILENAHNLAITVHSPSTCRAGAIHPFFSYAAGLRNGLFMVLKYLYYDFKTVIERKTTNNIMIKASKRLGNNFRLICHTERDRDYFKKILKIEHVYDHPLSHMAKGWKSEIEKQRKEFRHGLEEKVGRDKILVGTFGFLTSHKSYESAIKALYRLPEKYCLLMFGAINPNNITRHLECDAYLHHLMETIKALNEQVKEKKSSGIDEDAADDYIPPQRVFFMGSPDDFEFAQAIDACDICLFPYWEVGQSGSGPICQALELKKTSILSFNKMTLEIKKYYPNNFRTFDIGNYIQLAQLIKYETEAGSKIDDIQYDEATLTKFYTDVLEQRI